MEFEWDQRKADRNRAVHKVSFYEASTVFNDPLSVSVPDPDHSFDEARCIIVGMSSFGKHLIVSHVERGNRIRIISARELTRKERKEYEENDIF